ncbi:protein SRC2-like [Castanea sativa]|uniref:protein SRC2-like n=1 Tax=Castanea sativa TaxID=21020 RepID=UPI003F6541C0
MKPYAEVSICDSQNKALTPVQKSPHSELGSNPTWNFHVKLYIDVAKAKENSLVLVVKLMSHRISHGVPNKEIGVVRVPIVELLDGFDEAEANAVAEKQVTKNALSSDGKTQGTLNFSYKVGRTEEYPPAGSASPEPSGTVAGFGQLVKAFGEEITAALTSVGVSLGVAQAADSALNPADNEDEVDSEAGFGQLVKEV